MRKPVVFILAGATVLLLVTTLMFYGKYRQTSTDFANMQHEEESTRIRYGQAINEIAAIQDSLNAIVLGDNEARLIPSQLQAELGASQTHGDETLARVALLKAGIERTKNRIQQLDDRLKKSGVRIVGLERMVANLKRSVTEKEKQVALLTGQVDSLQTQVTGLVATVEDKQRELGTVYYVIGSKKDLTNSGVVIAKGGVLGLGKTLKPSGQVDESMFAAIDTDQETVIRIPSAKAQVLSAQPVSSYVLQPVGDELELHILDPTQFRKIRHLVIMT